MLRNSERLAQIEARLDALERKRGQLVVFEVVGCDGAAVGGDVPAAVLAQAQIEADEKGCAFLFWPGEGRS